MDDDYEKKYTYQDTFEYTINAVRAYGFIDKRGRGGRWISPGEEINISTHADSPENWETYLGLTDEGWIVTADENVEGGHVVYDPPSIWRIEVRP